MEEGMELRLLVSFALSIAVLFAFGWFFATGPEETPATPPAAPTTEGLATSQATAPELPASEAAAPAAASPAEEAVAEVPPGVIQAEQIESVVVDTAVYSLTFSNQGAVLQSVRLLAYDDGSGETLELIGRASDEDRWPLELVTGDAATDAQIRNALFTADASESAVQMEYALDGLHVVKEFHIDPSTYQIAMRAQVERDGNSLPFSVVWQGPFGEQYDAGVPFARSQETNVVYRDGTSFERLAAGDIEDPNEIPATTHVGVEDRYFLAMFLLPDARPPRVAALAGDAGEEGEAQPTPRIEVPYAGELRLYVGPQQEQRLGEVDATLTSVIDYGFFAILSRPMMLVLVVIQGYVVNWGWSIIVMTLLINFALFPLRLKQQLSMQKMQKIQPQMRTLQDKYKKLKANDPRRQDVQAEMMGLYKKHGVNPLGGCLPLLIQMPFLIAVFWLLQVAIELRQAPWILWIQDLAASDPYYILPILFGVSMFAQQKTMPTTMDPTQAKIMMIMPVMLTVMFIGSQSGLMLYWLTSNLFGFGQQLLIRKYWAPADKPKRLPAKEAPPPEEPAPVIEAEVVAPGEEPNAEPKRRKRRRKK